MPVPDARDHERRLIGHSPALRKEVAQLAKFLYAKFYRHERLHELTLHAQATLQDLFEAYRKRPTEMAPWYQQWAETVGVERSICDYIAGMTDRFAQQEHARLC